MTLFLKQGLCRLRGQEDGLVLRDDLLVLGLRERNQIHCDFKAVTGWHGGWGSSLWPQHLHT